MVNILDASIKGQKQHWQEFKNDKPTTEEEWRSSQSALRCSILQYGACFENMRRISEFFEFDFLGDEALIRGKYTWY